MLHVINVIGFSLILLFLGLGFRKFWRLMSLVPRRSRRCSRGTPKEGRRKAERRGNAWSWDFVTYQTANGSQFRILTLIDEHTRECLATHAGWSIRAVDVTEVIEAAIERFGAPYPTRSDNGTKWEQSGHGRPKVARRVSEANQFIAYAVQDRLRELEIEILYMEPGSPWGEAYVESFHDKLRDELLNREIFGSLREAQTIL